MGRDCNVFLVLNTEKEVILVEEIYKKYSKFMYKVAYSVLHNKYDSEDAVQQSFLRIIDNLDKIGDLEGKKLEILLEQFVKMFLLTYITGQKGLLH